jgi:PAS domain S-box-containing protein
LLVDQFLLAAHRALETGERLLPILGSDLWAILAFWMGSVSLGLLIAPSVRTTPDVLPAALILLVLLYAAAQAYLRAGHGDRAITGLVESAADLGADEPIAAMLRRIAEVARGIVHGCGARIELDLVELSAAAGEPLDPGEFATTIEVGSVGTVAASAVIEVDGHRLGELRAYVDPLAPSPSGGARRSERAALGILARQGAVSIVRSLAERRSRQHLEMIAQVFEHAHEGLVQLDRSGRVTACNPAAAQLLGRTCGGVTGTPVTSISAELGEAIAREVTGVHAIALVRPDGSAVTVDASIAAVRDSTIEQPVRSWVIALRDVTQAHETERLKSDFVATVSHELRTPLTTIRGFLETLLRDDVTVERDQVRSFLQIMRGESLRLERLINDLLDTSAIEAGRPPSIRTCTVDLVGEARRAAATFRAAHPGADLRFDDRVEAAGACRALADPDRMQQVLGNLLTNAARHGGGAPIELHVLPPEGGQPGLLVRDHGPGIPEREQARVFDRFYFTADSVTRRGGGAGLGLYICRRLTEAMGGTIAVDSRKGEGAAFVVRLPPATASSSGQGPGWDSVDRRRASSMACRAASTTRRVSASSTGSGAG